VRHGGTAWVLVEDDPARSLGRALAWARQHDVGELHVLAERETGMLARRAEAFDPSPTVWHVEGRTWRAALPAPLDRPKTPPPAALALEPTLVAAGADVVHEHGHVVGEILGLEIARVVVDDIPGSAPRIEVGVGRHDREAFALVHGDRPTGAALADVIATVRRHRRPDSVDHPLTRLATERWLREVLVVRPALVGATVLRPVEGPVPRTNVKDPMPAAAVGTDIDGRPLVVVCSVGIDLDLVPWASDARLLHAPDADLVLAVPERDDHPVTRALAAMLRDPAAIVSIPGDWRAPTGS
jgi:hypothetical protein